LSVSVISSCLQRKATCGGFFFVLAALKLSVAKRNAAAQKNAAAK